MRLHILSVANRAPKWVDEGVAEYQKRMKDWPMQFFDVPIASRKKFSDNVDKMQQDEAERLIGKIPSNATRVGLDVRGKMFNTEQLSDRLQQQAFEGGDIAFLIGGPDGLSPDVLQTCSWHWSISALTFPHPLVKIILAEQLYRAWSVSVNHPYHRGDYT